MDRFVCIHGHFYQPPRENPWLEDVELQESAYPYHDWNERIDAECYAPNAASRIIGSDNKIIDIVNNYSKISFNFGPTLLSWMEKHDPETYRAILEADKMSQEAFSGHGSAIAQVYGHMIMPLANRRDKYTQVKWGVEDFKKRFGRAPEGMWLPETAVDLETLDVLAELGIKFTVLSQHQAAAVRKIGAQEWVDVSGGKIDPKRAYFCNLSSGRAINIFFYDDQISHDIAFGGLLNSGELFADRLVKAFTDAAEPQLVSVATDGETYGHHHRFGDMALAYCIYSVESKGLTKVTNYGEYLEKSPPTYEVKIVENTSWSCAHGVERWRSNCGCNTGANPKWSQEWRRPLREAMDWLRDRLAPLYEAEASKYLRSPWEARDDYVAVILDRSKQSVEDFFSKHAAKELSTEEKRAALKLLEMQRQALLMYTSCGWFFDEISGLESQIVMRHAARAMQLARELFGVDLEPEYLKILKGAPSNVPEFGDGARVFEALVKPTSVDLIRVAVHYAASSLFDHGGKEPTDVYCYHVEDEVYEAYESGRLRMCVGRSRVSSNITWDEKTTSYAVLWLGDHNVVGGAREFMGHEAFSAMHDEIKSAFEGADVQETIRLMDKHFGQHSYSLKDLFKDEQRKITEKILAIAVENVESSYRRIFEDNYPVLRFLKDIGVAPPRALQAAAEIVVGSEILEALVSEPVDLELLEKWVDYADTLSIRLDAELVGLKGGERIASELRKLAQQPEDVGVLERVLRLVAALGRLPIQLDLWRSQNTLYSLAKQHYAPMKERAEKGDEKAAKWLAAFDALSEKIGVKIQP